MELMMRLLMVWPSQRTVPQSSAADDLAEAHEPDSPTHTPSSGALSLIKSKADSENLGIEQASSGSNEAEGSVDVPLNWAEQLTLFGKAYYARLCQHTSAFDEECTFCWQGTTLRCTGCGARFCTTDCRNMDRKFHKRVCKQFGAFDPTTRPSSDHFLAMVIPMTRQNPDLVWCQLVGPEKKLRLEHDEISDSVKNFGEFISLKGKAFHVNGSPGTSLATIGHGLAMVDVYGLKSSEKLGLSHVNQCLHSLTAPGALRFRTGPWIAFAFKSDESGLPQKGLDVVPRDWRYIVDHVVYDPSNAFYGEPPRTRTKPVTFGVKLNNIDHPIISLVTGIKQPLEDVCVPIFEWPDTGPSALAFQIGLPWKIRYIMKDGDGASKWVTVEETGVMTFIAFSYGSDRLVHSEHIKAFNKYLDFSLGRKIVPSRVGFMDYWEKHRQVLVAKTNRNIIATPYHGPPNLEELIQFGHEDDAKRRGVMNLMGHFAAKGFLMAVHEENGVFVPDEITAPFDSEGA
ncbi:unnamed protein product [Parascedosporium putredinis]|uniref:Suppressor of anucleate metulae protein B n=1 Tax=Parascedosporium putredinis TaxID=1442378 RepID=A0A9P1MFT2_9PEZI|nr:unnamed protein product [Parascedosporium putredinis]CAI8003050.1 unnamed protein product [Parascedosporium putredinis]